MKIERFIFLLVISLTFLLPSTSFGQWTQKSITHGNIQRQYWIYVSPNYDAGVPASIVVTLHGMGDDATNFRGVGFNNVADTANAIILVPDALVDGLTGMTAWNSSAGVDMFGFNYYPNSTIDDIDFINTIVNETIADYSVDATKVYACGFSMGAFMTQKLALEVSSPFAAFASVAGTFGSGLSLSGPGRAIPIAHFHGTEDATVGYEQNMFGSNVEELVNFWISNNNCNPTPTHTLLPDTQPDNLTVEHFKYENGDNNSVVELFTVNNAEHIWLHYPANDISYTGEIWKFFNQYTHQNLSIDEQKIQDFIVYPNPAHNILHIEGEINSVQELMITDIKGKIVYKDIINGSTIIDASEITSGLYLIQIGNTIKKVVIQ